MPRRAVFPSLLIVVAAGCAKETPSVQKKPRPVRFDIVGSGGVDDARAFSATIQSRDATPISFRVGGTLARLPVKMGDTVKKGQLIAELDASDYKVALAQAQANWQNAKTQVDVASSAFRRVETLYEAGSSSLSDYENARGQLKSARAQLSASGQAVKQAKNQIEYCRLVAPFDGVVESVAVKNGEQVGAARAVAVVSRGGEIEVNVGVPEGVVARIKVGTAATVQVAALGGDALAGKVREVGFATAASTYPVRIELADPPATLRPGMAATAEFELGTRKAALTIPVTAVGNEEKSSYVFFLEPAGGDVFTARKRPVDVGELIGNRFEVKKGVVAGDKIATAGLSKLVDGMQVRLLGGAATAAAGAPPAPGKAEVPPATAVEKTP